MIDKTWLLPVPRARLYAAWVSSDTVIPPATRMDVQPEVGGHYRLFVETPDGVTGTDGVFEVVEPEQRLVYGWAWDGGPSSRIEVDFEDAGAALPGGTRFHLRHTELENDDAIAAHDAGWDAYVEKLTARLR